MPPKSGHQTKTSNSFILTISHPCFPNFSFLSKLIYVLPSFSEKKLEIIGERSSRSICKGPMDKDNKRGGFNVGDGGG